METTTCNSLPYSSSASVAACTTEPSSLQRGYTWDQATNISTDPTAIDPSFAMDGIQKQVTSILPPSIQSPAQSQFQWDPAIIDYAMGNSTDNNASLAYSVAGSSGPSMAPTAAPSPKFNADNSNINDQFFDFDNSSKLVNWNDSIMVPAGQDFLNTYNYDQNFSTNDFNSQGWSS